MPAGGLSCFLFKSVIKINAIGMNLGHIQAANEIWNESCRMPGRTRCEFSFIDQYDIIPAFFRKMVGKTNPHRATTNNDNLSLRFQFTTPCLDDVFKIDY